jgi:5'(3')-deoxyribonucleotidase
MKLGRRRLLRELDESVAALTRERVEAFETGAAHAQTEAMALADLAEAIARSLGEWRDLLRDVDLARAFDARRAARLVLESVFDDILTPAPWRVLAAAVAVSEALT